MDLLRIVFLFFCCMVIPSIAQTALLPETTIKHGTLSYFFAEERLVLDALLYDQNEISTARCYFKTDLDNNYLYVSMNHLSGNNYQCVLPALRSGSQTLEYFFLIVNNSGQVIRSIPYVTKEAGSNVLPEGQSTVDDSNTLYVYSELGDMEKDDTTIIDGRTNLLTTKHSNQLYGLRAGVYEEAIIPDYLDCMPGYFGGFILDEPDTTPRPLKGFAPNLKMPADDSDLFQDTTLLKSNIITSKASEVSSPPNIAGDNWFGYYKITGTDDKEILNATIEQEGFSILLMTTKSGIGHYFTGSINTAGDMYLRDMEDDQIWTSHFGPATATTIGIYDYIELPDTENPDPPFYKIYITRPPNAPSEVSASDATFRDKIIVGWNGSSGATSYEVYTCSSGLTDSCSFLATELTESYDDTRDTKVKTYYRVKACNDFGCSEYSEYDIGYQQPKNIMSFLYPLLHSE